MTRTVWPEAFEHRFAAGDLEGHALGNLMIVGLAETLGDFCRALDEAGRLLNAVGRVLPATTDPVVLKADIEGEGRRGPGRGAELGRPDPPGRADPERRPGIARRAAAIRDADQIVLAPGSLYTSLLPVLCVPELRDALGAAPGGVVQVCNLGPQVPETNGLDAADHLRAVLEHGGRVDRFLYQRRGRDPGGRRGSDPGAGASSRWPPRSPDPTVWRTIP